MNILIIGGAGRVGTVIRPALEAQHTCYHFDVNAIPGVVSVGDASGNGRGYVGSIDDLPLLRHAMIGMDAIVNLTMGSRPGVVGDVSDLDAVFNVHVRGLYRILLAAQSANVRRIVTASTLSVFRGVELRDHVDENDPTDSWHPYGVSKRLGENLCDMAVHQTPWLGIVSLRLMMPTDAETFANRPPAPYIDKLGREQRWCYMGPKDTSRLFLAAIDYSVNPGHHVFHGTGEVEPRWFPCKKANELMGWHARGE
ncbi:MAG: NAD(P)-dependent oxidoreductase [Planctomycetota bacterium]|nr:NAD(P)-dependent oxidoreductase [Planctomycetota bacterium]